MWFRWLQLGVDFRCHQRDTNTGCVCFTTWPRYSLATCSPSICMWQGCQATTNFANQLGWRFLHMTCGTLWMWKLKNGHLFFRNQGPVLQSCPEHPGKAIPVEQTQPVTSSAIRLDSLMALRPMLRWTLLRCNDWCPADGSYQRGIVFFFCTFLDVFFQRILDPENRLKTQNRLLKKLQRKSRKNATVAFWETKRPPMWSQTQTWVFLVLVDPWKFTHIDMLLFCTYFFLIQLKTLECYILPVILPHLMLSWIGLHRLDWKNLRPGESRPCFCWSKSDLLSHDHRGYLGIPGDTRAVMTGCARFPTKTRLEPRQLPRSFSYSAYCSSL